MGQAMRRRPDDSFAGRTPEGSGEVELELDRHQQADGRVGDGALANDDARVRFETRTARGNLKRALALLDKLDRAG